MPQGNDLRRRLAALVGFDTQNPTGDEKPLVLALAAELKSLGARAIDVFAADGHHAVYAQFGEGAPTLLVNAHVDTVPANAGYTASPHTLVERAGKLYALGSADTKGAVAAVLDALHTLVGQGSPPRGLAVLFSGDEERHSACMRAFLASDRWRGLQRAIVCEPTMGRVGSRHRGIGSAEATTHSPGGHSSRADLIANPVTTLARAAVALDDWAYRLRDEGPVGFRGLCMNVAGIEGGLAFNVIPSRATLRMSLRPAPGSNVRDLLAEAEGEVRRAAAPQDLEWQVHHANPPFATRDLAAFLPLLGDQARNPVDLAFWTEAALLSASGVDAVVFGPGSIEQAHAPDEFVEVSQLEMARDVFLRVLSS